MALKRPPKAKPPGPKGPPLGKTGFPQKGEKLSPEETAILRERGRLAGKKSGQLSKGYTTEYLKKTINQLHPGVSRMGLQQFSELTVTGNYSSQKLANRFEKNADPAFREMYLKIAESIKSGEAVVNSVEMHGGDVNDYYALISNSDEFAKLCGKERNKFKWDRAKLQVAEHLADGLANAEIAELTGVDKRTISRWLNFREFTEYIDNLIMESGIANRRLRIATMKRVSENLLITVLHKLDRLTSDSQIDEESAKGLLSELREYAKLIAEEKRELVHIVESTNTTTLNAEVSVTHDIQKVSDLLDELDGEDRALTEQALKAAADELIGRYSK